MAENRYFSPSDYHLHLADKITPALTFEGGDVTAWQKKLRRKLKKLMGYGGEGKIPLNPTTLWQKKHKYGTIEKVVFSSEPYADVMAYICLPKSAKPPYPYRICLQGYSTGAHVSIGRQLEDEGKFYRAKGDRDYGIQCMKRGMAALCPEQRSFGERGERKQAAISDQMCHDATMHSLLLDKTLAAERVYDVDRAIDYLARRGDAEMQNIGVLGNPGGDTISLFSSALLPRISRAMPSCSICTFYDSILKIYHCADNYIPGLYQVADMGDILGLFAPRSLVVVAGKMITYFPSMECARPLPRQSVFMPPVGQRTSAGW